MSDIDFANLPFEPVNASAENADIYVMDAGKECFGWMRSYTKKNVEGTPLTIFKKGNGIFTVSWFDSWTGETIKTIIIKF